MARRAVTVFAEETYPVRVNACKSLLKVTCTKLPSAAPVTVIVVEDSPPAAMLGGSHVALPVSGAGYVLRNDVKAAVSTVSAVVTAFMFVAIRFCA